MYVFHVSDSAILRSVINNQFTKAKTRRPNTIVQLFEIGIFQHEIA